MSASLRIVDLHKTFRLGFFRKRVEAVRGVSLEVQPGEIFGLLGPNGAGKTTTLKCVLGLIFPTAGTIEILGSPHRDRSTMRQVGYMPENPYVYQYLKASEFLDMSARLATMGTDRHERIASMLDKVGLAHAADRPVGKFSKGMMQRVGLAQALLHDPQLLILDEPMSGLDPIGRKLVKDLLLEQRRKGKTLIFASHILSDVELLCDRVAILKSGRVTTCKPMSDLLRPADQRVDITIDRAGPELRQQMAEVASQVETKGPLVVASVQDRSVVSRVLETALAHGAQVVEVAPRHETLEELFLRNALDQTSA